MSSVIKDRELDLLKGLYQLRMLSAAQIKRAYYNNLNYAYKKVKALERVGYLESKPLIDGPSKKTQYYYLTQKGIDILQLQNARRADKNYFVERFLVERQLIINEIPVTIRQLERQKGTDVWQWQDSREAKRVYGFNMRDLIAGVLVNKKNGEKYGVYIPTVVKENRNADEISKYIQGLITQIEDEIDRHAHIRDNLVICHSADLLKKFRNRMKPVGRSLKILVINYGINYIYNLLTEYDTVLAKLYSDILAFPEKAIVKSGELFATHETPDLYLTEFMTYDIVRMTATYEFISRLHASKPVAIFCWDRQKKQVERDFKILLADTRLQLHTVSWDHSEIKDGVKIIPHGGKDKAPFKKVRMRFSITPAVAEHIQKMGNEQRSFYVEQLILKDMRKLTYNTEPKDRR